MNPGDLGATSWGFRASVANSDKGVNPSAQWRGQVATGASGWAQVATDALNLHDVA